MPYRILKSDASLEEALRRITSEQLGAALVSLDATGEDRAAAVHNVRKRCKKVRGLLRLMRPAFPRAAAENAALRDVARLLGSARDAGVLEETFDAVVHDAPVSLDLPAPEAASGDTPAVDRAALAPLRAALAAAGHAHAAADLDAVFAEARLRLEEVRTRAAGWSLRADGWAALAPGLAHSYTRARAARKRAAAKPTAERHHEWRKRLKDHWYHTRLLRPIQPDQLTARGDAAHAVARLLGHHHDCHALEQALAARPVATHAPKAAKALARLARHRRAAVEERAHDLGKSLQADKPAALAERWGEWWHAWRAPDARPAEMIQA